MKLAVLSNVNMEPIKTFFPETVFTKFNQYMKELLTQDLISTHDPDVVFIHIDAKELAGDFYYDVGKDPQPVMEQIAQVIEQLARTAMIFDSKIFVVSSFFFPPDRHTTYISPAHLPLMMKEKEIQDMLVQKTRDISNILCFDFYHRVVSQYGYQHIYDPKFWYLGRIPYTQKGFRCIAEELTCLVNAYRGNSRKVLILDLDNTLWGGIIGEDGINGISLSEDGVGKAFRDFQKEIKAQKRLGTLLAICSKNNETDAMAAFKTHPMMVLTPDDFVAMEINWKNKTDNIINIANNLNLGLDSFVFIDDNPVERELVKTALPDVAVPDFPDNPEELGSWFVKEVVYQFFPKFHLTAEDQQKTQQYQKYSQRAELRQTVDIDTFIRSLNIKLNLHVDNLEQVQRLAQLTQKTNQFNLTTRRYTENEIKQFMKSTHSWVFSLDYEDKFGKEGIIGEAIVIQKKGSAIIDTFLLSCRVLGRKVEHTFFNMILQHLHKEKVAVIVGEYVESSKNAMTSGFYAELGLIAQADSPHHRFTADIQSFL